MICYTVCVFHDMFVSDEGLKANLSVNSFSVVLVKKCYDLAKASMKDFSAQIVKQQNTTHVKGTL